MMVKNMDKILETTLNTATDSRIKIQMLRNFSNYLTDVEEKIGETDGGNGKSQGDSSVPIAAGAGDCNISSCGGIIQLHCDLILERRLDLNEEVRQTGLKEFHMRANFFLSWAESQASTPEVVTRRQGKWRDSDLAEKSQAVVDVVVCGGTLGVFLATALALRGLKVAIVERGPLRGRVQDWNVSRKELQELVNAGVLTQDEVEEVISIEFNPVSDLVII